jgi:hypothetical protein
MKSLIKYGLAAAMVFATAMPAMAKSWVVCVDTTKDARFSTEATAGNNLFFAAAAPIYPGATVTTTATNCTPGMLNNATQVGTFFTIGGGINGLPQSTTPDLADMFFVLWHFRITGRGAFDTTGPVRSGIYPQTIIGSTNPGLVPTHGKAIVTTLTTGTAAVLAFRITTP